MKPTLQRIHAVVAVLMVVLTGCTTAVNTLPQLAAPDDPTQYYTLSIPEGLEIKSVDFDVALFSDAEAGTTTAATQLGGRSFIKVYAVDRSTGEQVLLIYENIAQRRRPIQMIRFAEEALR